MNVNRLETSRLVHRFGFGPRVGEFASYLKQGVPATRDSLLKVPSVDSGLASIKLPTFSDLGKRPEPNSTDIIPFVVGMKSQTDNLILWWMDRMALSDNGLTERMAWFWHGHWATSISKINHPFPMYKQNETFRKYALGNFGEMSRAMLNDGALQYWLDGQESTFKSPNENLGRELMELFILGVNRYSEDDVKAIARSLTGYQVANSSGTVVFNPKRHDSKVVTLLGTTKHFTGEEVSDFLVARDDCARFISERLWYRFISSTEAMPSNFAGIQSFANREISSVVTAVAQDSAMRDSKNAMVKSPVDWFISAARALELTPSKLTSSSKLKNYLNKLGQLPLYPPSVGGWPAAEAWLSSASAQYRIDFATWLVKQSQLRGLLEIPVERRVLSSADWLGVAQWSPRTQAALRNSLGDSVDFAVLALCSPEYVVNA